MRLGLASVGVMVTLSACAPKGISPSGQAAGLTDQLVFDLEAQDWGSQANPDYWPRRAAQMKVPLDAEAIAIREVSCWKGPRTYGRYKCSYLVDWGRSGQIEGTYKRETLVGQDENGDWDNDLIFVVGG